MTLRASEIPQMVDVDGHIEEQLLRSGQGVTVRPLFQTIPLDDFEWNPADHYLYIAADQYLPQPPTALEGWERELYGVPAPQPRLSAEGCGCALCQSGADQSIRFRLDRWVPSKPLAPDEVRERALTLRQNRNTGPAQVPFRHRGGRR